MSFDILKIVFDFAKEVYHAGGAQVRWVVWIWCGFIFLYLLLGKYDSLHKQNIYKHRQKEEKNYFYALHLFGLLSIVVEYGYLLEHWTVYLPLAKGRMVGVITASGYGALLLGFAFVLLGRLYLNSFWGKDIYTYEEKETYKLVQDNVYSQCRHPIYFGQVCMCVGTAVALNNGIILAFAALMLLMNVYRARREDIFLQSYFGDEWNEYKKKVNFFFPFF